MKRFFRFIITKILTIKARQTLKKHRTQVIAVTGSIGKTSTTEAIYSVIKGDFNVQRARPGFNTELGMSLAIMQEEESGFSSPFAWLKILKRVFFEKKTTYQKTVLEMGADAPGDIKKLIKIAPPKIAVITNVAPVHLDEGQFDDIHEIAKEKSTLIKYLPKDGVAILNYDDPLIREMETRAQKITYGLEPTAMVRAKDVKVSSKEIKFTVTYKNQSEDFVVPALGSFQIYVFLPAIAVGLQLGMELRECAKALKKYHLPPGRMSPIAGVNKSMIIDSSYNASPATMVKALELLEELKADRKIAALGTMNELGDMTEEAHLNLGRRAVEVADLLITVGPQATTIKKGALEAGMSDDKIYTFFDSEEAGHFLKSELKPKDIVLAKGSQNRVRLERMVKVVMEHPENASELLCRQEEAWKKI